MATQTLRGEARGRDAMVYPVSTAARGTGQQEGSWQTPLGRHRIRARIGEGAASGSVFVRRRLTGEIWSPELHQNFPERDWILTRILWLTGRESGFNRGGDVDSLRRFIYIHGTPDPESMGEPHSHGCLRMTNSDVIELFDRVAVGTPVQIIADSREKKNQAREPWRIGMPNR
ncbi:MAG: L,D-transpeptidase family protein [Gammaproteobacteria bacterium]